MSGVADWAEGRRRAELAHEQASKRHWLAEIDDSNPFGPQRFSDERLLEILTFAACPIVCDGPTRRDGSKNDWHEWCERKAQAAFKILRAVDPPARSVFGGVE